MIMILLLLLLLLPLLLIIIVNGLRARVDGQHAVRCVLVVAVVCLAFATLRALPFRCTRRVGSSHLYYDGRGWALELPL